MLEKSFLATCSGVGLKWFERVLIVHLPCPTHPPKKYIWVRCILLVAGRMRNGRLGERVTFWFPFSVQLPRPVQASSLAAGGPFAATDKDACHSIEFETNSIGLGPSWMILTIPRYVHVWTWDNWREENSWEFPIIIQIRSKSSNPITGGMQVPMTGFQGQVTTLCDCDFLAVWKVSIQCLRIQQSFQCVWNGSCPNHRGILSYLQARKGVVVKVLHAVNFLLSFEDVFRHVSTCAQASESW